MHACVQELAERIGGRLRLGQLPPLGGPWEPVTRIVCEAERVSPGDLFWPLDPRGGRRAEEALLRGAAGVVAAGRAIEPFPGRYSIAVDDARWALWLWARDCRREATGRCVVVTGGAEAELAGELAAAVMLAAGGAATRAATTDNALASLANATPGVDLLLDLSRLAASDIEQVLEAAQPDVLLTFDAAQLPRATPRQGRGRVVIAGEGSLERQGEENELLVTVGRDPHCTFCASRVEQREGWLSLEVQGQALRLAAWGRHLLEPVLGAYAMGRTLNLAEGTIAGALADWRPERPRVAVTNISGVWLVHGPAGTDLAALEKAVAVLRELPCSGERIAICNATEQEGGKNSYPEAFWPRFAETLVARGGIDRLVACGASGVLLCAAAAEAGLPEAAATVTEDVGTLCAAIRERAASGDALLAWNLDAPTVGAALQPFSDRGLRAA